MNAAHQRRLTPVLGGTVVALGALWLMLLAGVGRSEHWNPPRPASPLPVSTNAADLPRALPLEQFASVWQKPVFNPDRKPIIRTAEGDGPGDLELTGVILTPTLRMALLHDKTADRQLRLREGQSLPDGSVTLVELHQRSATVDASGGRMELKLANGAPVDMPKPGSPTDVQPGGTMMRVGAPANGQPSPPDMPNNAPANRPSPASLERLRKIIQKRRAEQAAANQGVR
jgi:general secretion pathway protein N